MPPQSVFHIPLQTRCDVIALQAAGHGYKRISKVLKVPRNEVRDIVKAESGM